MQVERLPEWLPSGWFIQVKQRLSGVRDKYYIHSITGQKCRSKREVLQYIGDEEIASGRTSVGSKAVAQGTPGESTITKRMSGSTAVSVAQVGTSPPWLPSGWVVQVKERRSGLKDKYYIHSITGYKCRSKKEVLGYLGNGETACRRRSVGSKGRAQGTQSEVAITKRTSGGNAVTVAQVETSPPWLPSGWEVEVKERRSGLRDKYYIDPISGYKFRSKLEVGRYLENGELPKKVRKRRGELEVGRYLENGELPKQVRKRRGVNDAGSTCQEVQLETSPPWLPSGWVMQVKERRSGLRDKHYIDPVSGHKFRSKPEVARYLENGELPKRVRKKRGVNDAGSTGQKLQRLGCSSTRRCLFSRQSSKDCKMEFGEWIQGPLMTEEETPSNMQALDKNGLGCCSKSDLALIPLETEDSNNMQENIVHTHAKYVVPLSVVSPQNQTERKSSGKHGKSKSKFREARPQNGKALGLACRNSRRLAGLEPELAPEMRETNRVVAKEPEMRETNCVVAKEARAGMVTEKSDADFGIETQPNEPVARELGDQVAKKEHLRKLEEYQIKFREPLLDPCVSFAFRTLTGAVTVENSVIESQLLLQHVSPVSTENMDYFIMP